MGTAETGEKYALIADPTLRATAADYYFDLNRRTGLSPEDVTHCFITHSHYDHCAGVNYFPSAIWMAAPEVADELKDSEHLDSKRIISAQGEFLPGIHAVSLPGHKLSLHGLAFIHGGYRVLLASDSVMTEGHFANGSGMFEEDAALAARTLAGIKRSADIVVPGHGNMIPNMRRKASNG
jgi:glyoxylase-like metal-dependent hydrolase (beta-lactamase superfamily II)